MADPLALTVGLFGAGAIGWALGMLLARELHRQQALDLKQQVYDRDAQLSRLRAELAALEQQLRQRPKLRLDGPPEAEPSAALEAELAELRQRLAQRERELAELCLPAAHPVPPATAEAAVVGSAPSVAVPPRQYPSRPERVDDLTRIHGIGPRLAERLNALGVWQWAQIAGWSEADIEWFEPKLTRIRGRIRHDDWVGSARRLLANGSAG